MTTRGQPASASWVLSSQLPACTKCPVFFICLFVCIVFAVGSGDGIQFLMLVWQALQTEPLFLVKSVCPSSPASCPSPLWPSTKLLFSTLPGMFSKSQQWPIHPAGSTDGAYAAGVEVSPPPPGARTRLGPLGVAGRRPSLHFVASTKTYRRKQL